MSSLRLAIAANFTVNPVVDTVEFLIDELGIPGEVRIAPYNQLLQSLLDDNGVLRTNRDGINLAFVSLGEWAGGAAAMTELVGDFAAAVQDCADRCPVPHIVVCCPAEPRYAAQAHAAEQLLVEVLAGDPRIQVYPESYVQAHYPVAARHDAYSNATAHVPFTRTMFAALGTVAVRAVHAMLTPRPKVLVVDADNTLWDGVVGEDGVLGVRVGPARRELQEILLRQRAAGRLICIASKNDQSDVEQVLTSHPDMLLRPEHITAIRANWLPKPDNLVSIAKELGLGLDSFVFLDDSPVECAHVTAVHPAVTTLQVPADAQDAVPYLRHCWPLDLTQVTDEDRQRAERYRQERQRQAARTEAPSLAGFLEGLDLQVRVRPMASADVARTAQLTQRTNQFNLTTVRRTAAEIAALPAPLECLVVDVRDRFGDYGQVGVVVFTADPDVLRVETFLLSCRVLGRGVEHRILAEVGRIGADRGLPMLALEFAATDRNEPALEFVHRIPEAVIGGGVCQVSTAAAAAVVYTPPDVSDITPTATNSAPPVGATAVAGSDPAAAHRIATTLATAEQVLAAVTARRGHRVASIGTDDPVATTVAGIWSELLDFAPASADDDFYDLGGHSLLLVRFAARVRDEFGVELPIDVLFTDSFTIAEIAGSIRTAQLGQTDDELTALLAELDGLSDADVRALLDAES